MVKVIKDNSKKKCVCEHCDSILEYNMTDIILSSRWFGDIYSYIRCPICGEFIIVNIKYND